MASTFLCRGCAAERGLDEATGRQLPDPGVPDGDEPDTRLQLTAVLCIERSHYNCFVRCEDRWVFFDSMSDQEELCDREWRLAAIFFSKPDVTQLNVEVTL